MTTPLIKAMKRSSCKTRLHSSLQNILVSLCLLLLLGSPAQAEERPEPVQKTDGPLAERNPGPDKKRDLKAKGWQSGAYLDLGYGLNFNHPENGLWRSKGTTFEVDDPRVNMAMVYLRKETTPQSRWGMEFGLQAGVDTDKLVTEPPPAANEPISNADTYRHLYRANLSYLFPTGKGLKLTGGLINSYIGYEAYHAIQNPNYTKGYLLDFVPYFLFGAEALSPLSDTLSVALYVVSGWNYLANPNNNPSFGLQVGWKASHEITFTQNLYYGPDQEDTDLQYWRFFSDSILEWKREPFLLALAFDVGTEKQAEQMRDPRGYWMSGALWAAWHMGGPWSLAFRPEFYYDPDGLGSGAEQTIQAYTATLKYTFSPVASHTLVASLEYRYDRSTGPGGGFFEGEDNRIFPDQHLLIFALMWQFGR